ncbi:MAG: hypothetical protein JWQ43_682 [Glaciihabitans sp.]|nr:hypothetical protein [Glaciihabitans sp.]
MAALTSAAVYTVARDDWSDFFVMTGGAAAALAGLIIVAMSVNVAVIISIPAMTSRAAATIATLLLIVVSAGAVLIPGQDLRWLGAEILIGTLAATALEVDSSLRMLRAVNSSPSLRGSSTGTPSGVGDSGRRPLPKVVLAGIQVLPFLLGAIMLLGSDPHGLYWIAGGTLLVFIGSVANAWVLLVEILR